MSVGPSQLSRLGPPQPVSAGLARQLQRELLVTVVEEVTEEQRAQRAVGTLLVDARGLGEPVQREAMHERGHSGRQLIGLGHAERREAGRRHRACRLQRFEFAVSVSQLAEKRLDAQPETACDRRPPRVTPRAAEHDFRSAESPGEVVRRKTAKVLSPEEKAAFLASRPDLTSKG